MLPSGGIIIESHMYCFEILDVDDTTCELQGAPSPGAKHN
jgi:hypothetical protein